MSLTRLASAFASALLVLGACDPPIYTVGSDASTASRDASAEGGVGLATCARCLATPNKPGPGCDTEYSACIANPQCSNMVTCVLDECVGGPAASFLACGIPCAEDAGALAGNSPSLTLATPLYNCIVGGACKSACLTK